MRNEKLEKLIFSDSQHVGVGMHDPRSKEIDARDVVRNALGASPAAAAQRLVWDLPVRVMHWLLALAVSGAWLSHYDLTDWFFFHAMCGYVILVVTITRIIWGIVGTHHARFANFVRGPRSVIRYLVDRGNAQSAVGHNPVGALMVILLLALLVIETVTGLFANDQVANVGPLFGYVRSVTSNKLTGIHHVLANAIVICVCLHITAVLAHYVFRRENLVLPMITGRKPAEAVPQDSAIVNSRVPIAAAIGTIVIALLALLIYSAPEASLSF